MSLLARLFGKKIPFQGYCTASVKVAFEHTDELATGQRTMHAKVPLVMALWRAFLVKSTTPQMNFKIPIANFLLFSGASVESIGARLFENEGGLEAGGSLTFAGKTRRLRLRKTDQKRGEKLDPIRTPL